MKAIRYSNNQIADLSFLFISLKSSPHVDFDISRLAWIDLSFNNITTITTSWLDSVPNLCTLNIHANKA